MNTNVYNDDRIIKNSKGKLYENTGRKVRSLRLPSYDRSTAVYITAVFLLPKMFKKI